MALLITDDLRAPRDQVVLFHQSQKMTGRSRRQNNLTLPGIQKRVTVSVHPTSPEAWRRDSWGGGHETCQNVFSRRQVTRRTPPPPRYAAVSSLQPLPTLNPINIVRFGLSLFRKDDSVFI
ncbi:hypothetical protein J6590_052797 [Homalodisca vitripennis]|nr:hypothetical protein J6590_052797 [Homalodisca vitripennis]